MVVVIPEGPRTETQVSSGGSAAVRCEGTMGGMLQTSKATDRALLVRWRRDSDITARTALVERYLPFAQALARRYMQRGEQLDDLEQTAALALVAPSTGTTSSVTSR